MNNLLLINFLLLQITSVRKTAKGDLIGFRIHVDLGLRTGHFQDYIVVPLNRMGLFWKPLNSEMSGAKYEGSILSKIFLKT